MDIVWLETRLSALEKSLKSLNELVVNLSKRFEDMLNDISEESSSEES